MMISIHEANEHQISEWDTLVNNAVNGTIFHKKRFLSYHGNKFSQIEKFLIVLNGNEPWAQISLAIEPVDGKVTARSPYGASYGGFVFQSYPSYEKGNELLKVFLQYLREQQVDRLVITHPIACCSEYPLDTFYFNLMEHGFTPVNREVSSVYCFDETSPVLDTISKRARNAARKSEKTGVVIRRNSSTDDLWRLMEKTFGKHGAHPTHTHSELAALTSLLPDSVYFDLAYLDETPIAGIVYFEMNRRVNSSFYFCQDPAFRQYQALSYLVVNGLQRCEEEGFKYFDFGTSTVNMRARDSIFSFKESFSKIGFFRETFGCQIVK